MTDPISFRSATDTTRPGVLVHGTSDIKQPEDYLRLFVSAITGIDKTLVRGRWLQKVGTQPSIGTNWCAVGVDRIETWGTPYQHGDKPASATAPDLSTRTSWQTLVCTAIFYGSKAHENADILRDGLQLSQNIAELKRFGFVVQSVDDEIRHLPDLMFEQWVDRYDLTFRLGRSITRTFGIRTITNAEDIELITERGTIP